MAERRKELQEQIADLCWNSRYRSKQTIAKKVGISLETLDELTTDENYCNVAEDVVMEAAYDEYNAKKIKTFLRNACYRAGFSIYGKWESMDAEVKAVAKRMLISNLEDAEILWHAMSAVGTETKQDRRW